MGTARGLTVASRKDTLPEMSEAKLLAQVRALAAIRGWLCYHTHDSRRSQAGYPDLTLCRARPGEKGRVVFVELKSHCGRLTAAQRLWTDTLRAAGAEVHVWRPDDWDDIVRTLE